MDKKRYFAAYIVSPDQIAVFDSEPDRDRWASYMDEISDGDPCGFYRIGLEEDEAHALLGDRIYDESAYEEDEFLPWVRWVFPENGYVSGLEYLKDQKSGEHRYPNVFEALRAAGKN